MKIPIAENRTEPDFLEKLLGIRTISTKSKRIVQITIFVLWGGCLMLLIQTSWHNWSQISLLLKNAEYSRIIYCLIYYLANLFVTIIGWLAIIRTFKGAPNVWKNLQIFSATFAARRLPGTVWYVGGRLFMYQKYGIPKSTVLVASAIELLVAFSTAGGVGIGLMLGIGEKISFVLSITVILLSLAGFVLMYPDVFKRLLHRAGISTAYHAKRYDWLFWIISFSVMWVMGGLMVVEMVKVFKSYLGVHEYLYVIGAWALSGMAGLLTVFLPSSFGATELSLIAFLGKILPLPIAGTIAISTRLFTMLMEVILAAAFYPFIRRNYDDFHEGDGKQLTSSPELEQTFSSHENE
jgi:glycosyltransferase 2 family protein